MDSSKSFISNYFLCVVLLINIFFTINKKAFPKKCYKTFILKKKIQHLKNEVRQ